MRGTGKGGEKDGEASAMYFHQWWDHLDFPFRGQFLVMEEPAPKAPG